MGTEGHARSRARRGADDGRDPPVAESDRGRGLLFFKAPADAPAEPHVAVRPAPLSALAGVLAAQELVDRDAQRRRALRRGSRLLERLDALRLTLLEDRPTSELRRAFSAILREPVDQLDGGDLADVIGQIELRAAVELAKLERDASLDGAEIGGLGGKAR